MVKFWFNRYWFTAQIPELNRVNFEWVNDKVMPHAENE